MIDALGSRTQPPATRWKAALPNRDRLTRYALPLDAGPILLIVLAFSSWVSPGLRGLQGPQSPEDVSFSEVPD